MTDYPALCAQAEAAMHPETIFVWINPYPDHYGGGWDTDPTNRNIRYVRGDKADALIAAIRELEADRNQWRVDCEEFRIERDEAKATANKLQEEVRRLGRELNTARYGQPDFSWSIHKEAMAEMTARAETAEATAATLTAQVEAMRDALDNLLEAITASNQIGDRSLTITGPTANLKWLLEACEDARAALTTEKTNG